MCAHRRALFLAAAFLTVAWAAEQCDKRLYEAKGPKTPGSKGFVIEIEGHTDKTDLKPIGFVPGKTYKIALRGWQTKYTVQTFRGFGIVALQENGKPGGRFEVPKRRRGPTRTAPNCRVAGISHSNLRPKTSAHVLWRAPDVVDGCVIFTASVIESRDVWYADEEGLTKKFCVVADYQKIVPNDDSAAKCCACDEAKYEMEFIGLWSKETHPKDYPPLLHLTHFTDMFGGSHSRGYSLWRFGDIATDGMKEIAEWGNAYKAEQELRENATEVRTIIKMKGLWYPEVQGRTTATFNVNNYHHLVSLASMFGPSPDWCVGVSAINLCLPDCSWVEERVFDLLPFDAGTDNGPTYMSPNSPAEPRLKIAPITTKTDRRSPFYDETSDVIPPLAKLIIRRANITASTCKSVDEYKRDAFNASNTSEDEEYKDRRECLVSNWESWSLCSATCGKGIRMRSRVYVFPVKAQMFNCHRPTTERQFCNAKINECEDSEAFNSKCSVSSWEAWSDCSVTCGHGQRTRKRHFMENVDAEACHVNLQEHERCIGDNGDDCSVTPNPLCRTTSWSEWSPCSASCDDGVRVRTRLFFYTEYENQCSHINLMENDKCQMQSCRRLLNTHSDEICQEEKEEGQCGGTFPRYWYNAKASKCERFVYTGCKGNRNQFETEDECKQLCVPGYATENAVVPGHQLINEFGSEDGNINDGGEPIPCLLTEWSPWGNCSVTCGRGKRTRTRNIKAFPRNGGTPCPPSEHMIQERRCDERPCALRRCVVGNWSMWSACSVRCGEGSQVRVRRIIKSRLHLDELEDATCRMAPREERMCRMPCSSGYY
ncbi:hypothetical protein QR680_000658 [Steinernema hermaphroditum]|uniref:Spondin-1 n=1 Tax=Steinernema hermaphroditum TaxID=289476 RepID=A0AA39LDZ5_9BILA|nr:hypothetical protein QR680_000658 [Steinernema hermaphroditum]